MPINLNFSTQSVLALKAQLKDLQKQIEETTDAGKKNALIDQFTKLDAAIKETNTSMSNLGSTFEEVYGEDAKPLSAQLGELEDRMYELAFAGKAGGDEFKALQAEAVRMRQTILAVDETVDDLANNRGISSFGSQLGEVGASLLSLDFNRAAGQAKGLAQTVGSVNFKGVIGQVKMLGSTFLNLGKAILGNPFFLLVAGVVALGVAIVKLLDEVGLLTVIMEGVGKVFDFIMTPIRALIQGLKDLTDWFGWTNNAATEAAEAQAAAAEKAAEAQTRSSNETIQALDNELRVLKSRGELNDEDFERSLEIEKEKRKQLELTAKARYDEAKAAYDAAVLKGDLDEEELKDLEDKLYETRIAVKQAREEIRIGEIEDNAARKTRQDKQLKEEKSRIDEETKKRKDAYAKRLEEEEAYNQQRLNIRRMLEDLDVELMEEGADKELKANERKYERLIQDTLANENLLQSEKDKLIANYEALKEQKDQEIRDKALMNEKALQDELQAYRNSLLTEERDRLIVNLDEQYNTELDKLKGFLEQELITREEYNALVIEAAKRKTDAIKAYDDQVAAETKQKMDEDYLSGLESNARSLQDKLFFLEEQRRIALENTELTEEQRKQIDADYAEQRKQIQIDAAYAAADSAMRALNAVQGLSDSLFAAKMSNLEKGSAAELAAAKKQFEINKKLNIAAATVTGVISVMEAYKNGMKNPLPLLGPATAAIYAGIAAVTVAANIKKIASAKFEGGGGGAATGGRGASSAAASAAASAVPTINLNGSGSDDNTVSAPESREAQPITVKAVVSETEITDTQRRVSSYEKNAEL